jgi:hypothetical protein
MAPIPTLDAAAASEKGAVGLVVTALSSAPSLQPQGSRQARSPALRVVIRRSELKGVVHKGQQIKVNR